MKTVYDIYHWSHPDATAEVTYGYDSREQARDALTAIAALPDTATWVHGHSQVYGDDYWLIDPDPVTGRQTEWGVFERRQAETDTERVQLALELLERDGQVDGSHHLRWVIDQTVRILAGDGYDAWVTAYRDGEDGPETYSWDVGIAP